MMNVIPGAPGRRRIAAVQVEEGGEAIGAVSARVLTIGTERQVRASQQDDSENDGDSAAADIGGDKHSPDRADGRRGLEEHAGAEIAVAQVVDNCLALLPVAFCRR